ncbi:cupin domain-containing protein [Methanothermococcus sp. Ax23]|jgi:quercetin dioxygenase-like cupin family protein|uniref:cupin domain-containing protein n=1 Tax=Methanothermococcus sp. Ax23 TaxID=3156486 RepID=UPI003BA1867D
MIETVYNFTTESDSKVVEKIVNTDEVQIIHMIFPKGEGTPKHFTNSKVHLIVVKGEMTLTLEGQEPKVYPAGTIIHLPFNTKMIAQNLTCDVLEFFVIKAPHPSKIGGPEEPIKINE